MKVVMPVKGVPNKAMYYPRIEIEIVVDAILVIVKGNGEKNGFSVRLKLSLRCRQDALLSPLFSLDKSESEDANLARSFSSLSCVCNIRNLDAMLMRKTLMMIQGSQNGFPCISYRK